MEENNIPFEEQDVPAAAPEEEASEVPATDAPRDDSTVKAENEAAPANATPDAAPADGEVAPADEAEVKAPADGEKTPADEAKAPPAIATDWQFGAPPAAAAPALSHGGKRTFAAVFASVVALCMALLLLVLFLGEGGIKILRTVHTDRNIYVHQYSDDSGLLTPSEAAEVVAASTVTIYTTTATGNGIGSGFVYRADGIICTNAHVIEDATAVQVVLPNGNAVDATVLGSNEPADIAVLKIEATDLVPIKLGSSANLLVGEDVVAVGTPASLAYQSTKTFGKVSATNRILALTDDTGMVDRRMTVIQTDTSVNPGNSGGPLANMYGEIVGIVVMKVATYGGIFYDGIGFAIPIDNARPVIDAIIEKGSFTGENPVTSPRNLVGITGVGLTKGYWYLDPVTNSFVRSEVPVEGGIDMPFDGVYVSEVSGSNAKGKLLAGDIIVKINGLTMRVTEDIIQLVNRHQAYETVNVTVKRYNGTDYEELTVAITLLQASE